MESYGDLLTNEFPHKRAQIRKLLLVSNYLIQPATCSACEELGEGDLLECPIVAVPLFILAEELRHRLVSNCMQCLQLTS